MADANFYLNKRFGTNYDYSKNIKLALNEIDIRFNTIEALSYNPQSPISISSLRENFIASINPQLEGIEKNSARAAKKYLALLEAADKCIALMQNAHKLYEVINSHQTYSKMSKEQGSIHYENLRVIPQPTLEAVDSIFSRSKLFTPTNLKHLDYLNNAITATIGVAVRPNAESIKKLDAASKKLENLTVSRSVQVFKGALKGLAANTLRLLNVGLGLIQAFSVGNVDTKGFQKRDDRLADISKSGFNDLINKGKRATKSAQAVKLKSNLKLFGDSAKQIKQTTQVVEHDNRDRYKSKK